jgi:hypothetical protein
MTSANGSWWGSEPRCISTWKGRHARKSPTHHRNRWDAVHRPGACGKPTRGGGFQTTSDCVAATALNHLKISELHQQDKVKSITDWIVLKSGICDNQLASMRYIWGSYFADLPRAVDERIRIAVAKRIASQSGDDYRAIYATHNEGWLNLYGAVAGIRFEEATAFVGPTPNRFVPDDERIQSDPGKFNMVGDVSKLSRAVIAIATSCWWDAEACFGLNPGDAGTAPAARTAEGARITAKPTTTGAASATKIAPFGRRPPFGPR